MPSIRFRLEPGAAIAEAVAQKFGVAARVLSTEEVRVGGIGGFFARRFTDVVVDLPEPAPPQEWTAHRLDDLLDRADRADGPATVPPLSTPPLSTETDAFTDVLDGLRRYVSPHEPVAAAPRPRRPVVLLRAPGDLVVVAGLGGDPMTVARALAGEQPMDVAPAGRLATGGPLSISDYRSAFAARARGLDNGRGTIAAYGIEPIALEAQAAALVALRPDQVWLAVDASRKAEDTQRWVDAIRAIVAVQALAVLRADWTSTPQTLAALGLPEAWSDASGIG